MEQKHQAARTLCQQFAELDPTARDANIGRHAATDLITAPGDGTSRSHTLAERLATARKTEAARERPRW